MEKKQLFNNSLVGFHPEIFDSYLQISVDIGDNDYTSNFSIDQTITVDDDFINNYNNTPVNSVGVLAINMTYNGDQTVRHIMNFVKGNEGSYANHIRDGFTYCISINNINTVDKTIDLTISSRSDNTVIRLTTTINGLTDLTPGDFNETVTLTDEEYNAFNEVANGEIFVLINNIDSTSFLVFKVGNYSFRGSRDYINNSLSKRSLVSFLIELGENNQATFKGNVTRLMNFNNYLAKDNTTEYTPTSDYNPATKKYVDDKDNVAKLRLYNGKISLQHTAGKSLINDTCTSFADFITIFDNMSQLDGTNFTNPFTGMTLPTNVNEFIEAFQTFQSTYNVFDAGHLVHPMIGAHASDENIIIVGFYRHNIGPAEIQFGDVSYLNWQANSVFGIGINSSTGNYVQIDNYQISTLSLDRGLVANLINKINNLDLSNYIAKNNTVAYTPTGDYNPATKKYVDRKITSNVNVPIENFEDKVIDMSPYLINNRYDGFIKVYSYNFGNEDFNIKPVVSAYWSSLNSYGDNPHSIIFYSNNKLIKCTVKATKNYCINIHFDIIQRVLTESEYAALGTAPGTDNILYFVTSD